MPIPMKQSVWIMLALLPFGAVAQKTEKKAIKEQPAAAVVSDADEDKIFRTVEEQAEFPGGKAILQTYLKQRLHYPMAAQKMNIEGEVMMQFTVDRTGKISDIRVLRDIGGGCGKEATRLVEEMPRWRPAKQAGRAVGSFYTLAIPFHKKGTADTTLKK